MVSLTFLGFESTFRGEGCYRFQTLRWIEPRWHRYEFTSIPTESISQPLHRPQQLFPRQRTARSRLQDELQHSSITQPLAACERSSAKGSKVRLAALGLCEALRARVCWPVQTRRTSSSRNQHTSRMGTTDSDHVEYVCESRWCVKPCFFLKKN